MITQNSVQDLKVAAFTGISSLGSLELGWIKAATAMDTIQVSIISMIIGYIGSKLFAYVEKKIKERIRKRKKLNRL